MARAKTQKQNGSMAGSYNGGNIDYCSLRLSSKDAEEFKAWMSTTAPEFEQAMDMALQELYRVTFKADINGTGYMCTFTQQDFKHVNANVAIVSRSDDPIEAFYITCYKIFQMYPNQRVPTDRNDSSWG